MSEFSIVKMSEVREFKQFETTIQVSSVPNNEMVRVSVSGCVNRNTDRTLICVVTLSDENRKRQWCEHFALLHHFPRCTSDKKCTLCTPLGVKKCFTRKSPFWNGDCEHQIG